MKKTKISNNITTILKVNKNTPRVAVCIYFHIDKQEKKPGIYTLLNRLFLQGTKNKSAEQIANELDENAIECYSEMKHDYIRFRLFTLNEDLELGLSILADIIKNSTFEQFDKELEKLKGEIISDLDSPKTKASDAFYRNFFNNLSYGNTYTKILENLESLTKQDVISAYKDIFKNSEKIISVVGDFKENSVVNLLEKYFSDLKTKDSMPVLSELREIKKNVVKIEKEDAQQAQIYQGWSVPTFHFEDYVALSCLNVLLGAGGLSSRLFLELRDKKGLAYTVRSSLESYERAADFNVYIGTAPKNIKTALEGFKIEIDKVKNELISPQELKDVKNSIIGKRNFYNETNSLQACFIGLYETQKLGYDYEKYYIKAIKKVTATKIRDVARKYLNDDNVLVVLAPKKYLENMDK